MTKLEQVLNYTKYTAGSYYDAISSIPIWVAEKISRTSDRLFGEKNPRFLSWQYTQDRSPIYKSRETLREKLDTRPGALFLQSNVIGAIPFVVAGMPAAEAAQAGIDYYLSNAPEIVKYATNSLSTLLMQMAAGYTVYMGNEVRVNFQKYSENGNLKARKVWQGFKTAAKAFLKFDLTYIGLKTGGQSTLLGLGEDPWKASGIFDTLAIPIWYTVAIPLALKNKVIETKNSWQK